MERSQEEKILGGLAHVSAYFNWIGVVANVVLVVLYREKSKYVYAHAKQGLSLSVLGVIMTFLLNLVGAAGIGLMSIGSLGGMIAGGLVWGLIGLAWGLTKLVLVILGAVNGFQGKEYLYPLFGKFVDQIGEDKAA